MKYKLAIVLFFFCLPAGSFSQTVFFPGKIKLSSGDSLTGEIGYGQWRVNPENIKFRSDNKEIIYSIKELASFQVFNKDEYKRFTVSYYLSPSEMADAKKDFGNTRNTDTVWLRLLYSGVTDLYELNTAERSYFFVANDTGGVDELVYRVRMADNQLYKDESYKERLSSYITDEARKDKLLKLVDYNSHKLLNFFNRIQTSDLSIAPAKKKTVKEILIGAGVLPFVEKRGGNIHTLNGPAFSAGFAVLFNSNRNFGQYFMRIGANINNFQFRQSRTVGNEEVTKTTSAFSTDIALAGGMIVNPLAKTAQSLTVEAAYNITIGDAWEPETLAGALGFARFTLRYLFMTRVGNIGPSFSLLTNNAFLYRLPKFFAVNYAYQFK